MNDNQIKIDTDKLCLGCIYKFLNVRFAEIFGNSTMSAEKCIVYNDPNAECPMLVTNTNPIMIRVAQSSLSCWAQTIYQFSHELCHYAIRQHKTDKSYTLKWFEDIVCEAASLYFLSYSAKNWNECELSKFNSEYNVCIEKYLNDQLNKPFTDGFQKCDNVDKLRGYNEIAESDRESHRWERNKIFSALLKNPMDLKVIADYEHYLCADRVIIDFKSWIRDNNCETLRIFDEIMPVKH